MYKKSDQRSAVIFQPLKDRLTTLHIGSSKLIKSWWIGIFFLLLIILFVWPLLMMVLGGFRSAAPFLPGEWTLNAWSSALQSPGLVAAVFTSIKISVMTTLCSIFVAAILSFISERTTLAVGKLMMPVMVLIFMTPFLFYTIAFTLLANPYTGLINDALRFSVDLSPQWLNVQGWLGIYTVVILKKVAFCYLFLVGAFKSLDGRQDEASYTAGASQLQTFFRINLPSLAPALSGITLLGLIIGLQIFEPVLLLGGSEKIVVISTLLMSYISGLTGAPRYAEASILSSIFVVVVTILYLIQLRILGKKAFYSIDGKGYNSRKIKLSMLSQVLWSIPILLYLLLAFVLPIGALIFSSFQPYPGVYSGFSFNHYIILFQQPRIFEAFRITLILGFVVGFLVALLALLVSVIGQKLRPRLWSLTQLITLIPLAMPGVIATVAVTWAYLSVPGLAALYGSIWLVALALMVISMPIACQLMNAAQQHISPALSEAARVCGASATQTFFEVVLRLVLPSFIAGWFMTAIMVAGNLEVPLLLKSPGLNTLAMVSYNIQMAGDYGVASALLVIIMLLSVTLWSLSKLLQWLFKANKKAKPLNQQRMGKLQ
jgi:iron(III) transport system permease protein